MPFAPPATDTRVSAAPPTEGFRPPTSDQMVSAAPETETYSGLPALNRGIARFLGAPVDIVNAGLSLVGLSSPEPLGGSRSIERGFGALGIGVPQEGQKPTFGGRVLEEVGAALPGLPLAGAASLLRGTGAVSQGVQQLGRAVVANPVTSTALETAGAASAGVGAATAREAFPDNPTAETLGALAGGFGLPMLVNVTNLPTRLLTRAGMSQFRNFTKAGAEAAASRRLKTLAAEAPESGGIDSAIARLQDPDVIPSAGLSAAEITGNRRLLALERAVMAKNSELEGAFLAKHAAANERLRNEIAVLGRRGNPEATRNFLAGRRDYLLALVGERAQRAATAAEQKITKLGAKATPEVQSQIVGQELRSAYDDALAQADELWGQVPLTSKVQSDNTRNAIQRMLDGLGKYQNISDLPKPLQSLVKWKVVKRANGTETKRLVPRVGVVETAKDLHLLRKDLLSTEMRLAPDVTNRQALARVQDVQEAVLSDLSAARTGRGDLYDTALDFEQTVDRTFRQGTVGRTLGIRRTGEPSIPDALTLQRVIGSGGPGAGVATDDLIAAVDGAPAAVRSQIEDYLKVMFAEQTARGGKVQPAAAARFLERNRPILDRFPALRDEMADAVKGQQLADRYAFKAESVTKGLQNKQQSRAALFLEAPPGLELNAVARSQNPREAARALKRMAARDPTGEAQQGLKTAFLDMVTTGSGLRRFTDVEGVGTEFLGGNKMRQLLESKSVAAMADELLSPTELNRLKKITRTLERLESAKGTTTLDSIADPADTPIIEYVIRTYGARLGAAFGQGTSGASLRTASIWSNYFGTKFQQLMNKIAVAGPEKVLIDAVQDRDLMLSLLTRGDAPLAARKLAARRINAWAIAELGTAVEGIEDDVPAKPEPTP